LFLSHGPTDAAVRRAAVFLDRSERFAGPLESAATYGIMRTFEIYKPARENASFLEVRHLDNRYLGVQSGASTDRTERTWLRAGRVE
jgi:hypothetical protein